MHAVHTVFTKYLGYIIILGTILLNIPLILHSYNQKNCLFASLIVMSLKATMMNKRILTSNQLVSTKMQSTQLFCWLISLKILITCNINPKVNQTINFLCKYMHWKEVLNIFFITMTIYLKNLLTCYHMPSNQEVCIQWNATPCGIDSNIKSRVSVLQQQQQQQQQKKAS
jgi:hypothetical protein